MALFGGYFFAPLGDRLLDFFLRELDEFSRSVKQFSGRQLQLEHSSVRFQHFWILIARGLPTAFPCDSKHAIASDA
jgi:hypothetical protein